MLKTLIKRDGTVQDYDANKANGWGEFAAKTLGSYVDWSSIVLETVSRLGEECTTLDFQKGLIYSCLNRKTWEYNRMAGRLYAPQLVREFYGEKYPTVQQLHAELFSVGMMVYLNYSNEEYAQVEDMINHNQDLKYAHFQIHQIRTKYALRNKVLKKEYETPQFVFMRMAMALAEAEPKEQRMGHVKKWYTYLSKNKINAPTPNYVNLGTRLNGYASCCVYTTHDTAASLAAGDHIAYMMTCMSAGIGSHIKTRSLGDPIRGGLIEHQGKLPYYRAMVGAIGANLQNGRGGASTVHYTAFDPEVATIQKLRHPMTPAAKRIAGAHYSFGSNKLFARKVAREEMYAPFSYQTNPDLYNAQYAKDQSIFERLYMEYEKNATFKLSAREVLVDALRQAYETGVQYDHRTDELNKHTPFKETIWSSNLCVTGDTNIDIKLIDGTVINIRMDQFVEQYDLGRFFGVKVKSYDLKNGCVVWSDVTAAAQTDIVEELYEIEDSTGKIIKCTAEHQIFTKNRGYVMAKDLIETDVLCQEI
jgi:ribonucleoside-diphosphate reductase alpha chain